MHASVYNTVLYYRCAICISKFEIGSELKNEIRILVEIVLGGIVVFQTALVRFNPKPFGRKETEKKKSRGDFA